MQADEIIQQKEWHELTPAEMQEVHELAENEQEYNLLKKMMQVSGEEAGEAPLISPSVKEHLAAMVREQKPAMHRRYLYLAAAAVAALIFAGILLFPKKTVNDGVAINTIKPNDTAVIVKKEATAAPNAIDTSTSSAAKDNIAQQPTPAVPANTAMQPAANPDNANRSYAAAAVHVGDDPALVNLVTEIY